MLTRSAISTQTTAPLPHRTLRPSGFATRRLFGGRRLTHLDVGRLGVASVIETPAEEATDAEWELIEKARQSYVQMWGEG